MAGRPEASRENGKKGGRPKGAKSASTLERERVQAAFNQRVMQHADRLFNAQLSAAEGVTFLFKRHKTGGKVVRVTSEEEIRRYLDTHGPEPEVDVEDGTYYFLATERPNHDAVDRMLNRAFGKATEKHEVSGADGKAIVLTWQ